MNCPAAVSLATLIFCLPAQACSSPQADKSPAVPQLAVTNTMLVNGDGPIIDLGTRICVSGDVTLSAGLDEVGVNAMTDSQLAGFLHGRAQRAVKDRGQPGHMPNSPSQPRVLRGEDCGPEGVALRATLDPGPEGVPYRVRLTATQGTRTFTAEISRNGLVRAPFPFPVPPGGRLPDGRPYWDVITDLGSAFEAFKTASIWSPAR